MPTEDQVINVPHDLKALREALADQSRKIYWFNVLTSTKDRVINVRQRKNLLQVQVFNGQGNDWFAIDDPRDLFTSEPL